MHGYDISPDMVRLSLVNMYLHGVKEPQIFGYDSLTSEDHWNEFSDVILANPPFMSPKGGIRPHKRFSVQSNRSEVLFVDYIIEHLTQDGRAAVIVPEGIIFQSGNAYKQLRKMLVEKYLVGVISLPASVFQPYSGVKTSILWLDKSLAKKTDKILFVKIENDGFDLGAQRRAVKGNNLPEALHNILDYKNLLKVGKQSDIESELNLSYVTRIEISGDGDYNLSGERYKILDKKVSKWGEVKIGEIATIVNGRAYSQNELLDEGLVPVLRVGNFFSNREWYYSDLELPEDKYCVKGDLLYAWSASFGPRIWEGPKAIYHYHIWKIIPSDRINKKFLYYVLDWDTENMKSEGGRGIAMTHITKSGMEERKIPLPPLSVQEEIVEEVDNYQKIIDGARQVVENYRPHIDIDPEWEMVEVGSVFSKVNKSVLPTELHVNEINYIGLENISQGSGELERTILVSPKSIKSTKTVFKAGDVLYGKLRPNLNKVYFSEITGICSTDIFVLRGNGEINSKLYSYFFLSIEFNSEVLKSLKGAQLPRVGYEDFSRILIPLPPLEKQRMIVEQMDQEQSIVRSNKILINLFERKIKDRIAKVWGE